MKQNSYFATQIPEDSVFTHNCFSVENQSHHQAQTVPSEQQNSSPIEGAMGD